MLITRHQEVLNATIVKDRPVPEKSKHIRFSCGRALLSFVETNHMLVYKTMFSLRLKVELLEMHSFASFPDLDEKIDKPTQPVKTDGCPPSVWVKWQFGLATVAKCLLMRKCQFPCKEVNRRL